MNTKRRELTINTDINLFSDNEDDGESNVVTPPNFRRRLTIGDIIGDYFDSSEGKILFNCKQNESVYNCLSRRIDKFNSILNNKMCISEIVNKAKERDCELNCHQTILMLNRMKYLRQTYLFILQKDSSNKTTTFTSSCKKAIDHIKKIAVLV